MFHDIDELQASSKTAITRSKASVPTRILEDEGLLVGRILDFGCGKGKDTEWLRSLGYDVECYDPNFFPNQMTLMPNHYDTVICNYVLNVAYPRTRIDILRKIYEVLKHGGKAYITVRDTTEIVRGTPLYDGVVTSKGTFQKLFDAWELHDTISDVFPYVEIIKNKRPLMGMGEKI
jgi:DNA phosphorothioation-associated putative methyltransferase